MKKRNPIAAALQSPHLRKQIVSPKKGSGSYNRKDAKPSTASSDNSVEGTPRLTADEDL